MRTNLWHKFIIYSKEIVDIYPWEHFGSLLLAWGFQWDCHQEYRFLSVYFAHKEINQYCNKTVHRNLTCEHILWAKAVNAESVLHIWPCKKNILCLSGGDEHWIITKTGSTCSAPFQCFSGYCLYVMYTGTSIGLNIPGTNVCCSK